MFTSNSSSLIPFKNDKNLNHSDNTYGYNFNGLNIQEKNGISNYLSICIEKDYSHASQEELRLADYEKKETGNVDKYKINDISSKIL